MNASRDNTFVITTFNEMCQMVHQIRVEVSVFPPVVGIRIEKSKYDKMLKTAVLEIASLHSIFLVRLHLLNIQSKILLRNILMHDHILKVGVGIQQDLIRLMKDYDIAVVNWFDLRYLSNFLEDFPTRSLRYICKHKFKMTLPRSGDVIHRTWFAPFLSEAQIKYGGKMVSAVLNIFILSLPHLNVAIMENKETFRPEFKEHKYAFLTALDPFSNRDFHFKTSNAPAVTSKSTENDPVWEKDEYQDTKQENTTTSENVQDENLILQIQLEDAPTPKSENNDEDQQIETNDNIKEDFNDNNKEELNDKTQEKDMAFEKTTTI